MADNIEVTPGTGAVVRTVDRGGTETQVLLIDRSDGTGTENLGLTGAKTSSSAAPTTTSGSVLAANDQRKAAIIHNAGTAIVYVGASGVTTSTGIPLAAGATITDDVSTDAWHAVMASGTGDLRIIEVA